MINLLNYTPDLTSEHWQLTVSREDLRLLRFTDAHYSVKPSQSGVRMHAAGPGEFIGLMTATLDAAFIWLLERYRRDGQTGVNCTVFRNESAVRSSLLIEEAVEIASRKWPHEHLFTFVNPNKIKSSNPGYCFLKAGWQKCGHTQQGLLILEWGQS